MSYVFKIYHLKDCYGRTKICFDEILFSPPIFRSDFIIIYISNSSVDTSKKIVCFLNCHICFINIFYCTILGEFENIKYIVISRVNVKGTPCLFDITIN
jgi:hypothetical protein